MIRRPKRPRGTLIYDGPSMLDGSGIIAVAVRSSDNEKTGNMVQVYILARDIHPVEAIKLQVKMGTCGYCPLLGDICYVRPEQAPTAVWHGYNRGIYPVYDKSQHGYLFKGRKVRWGADGDPAALPLRILYKINRLASGHTGYSHQLFWIDRKRADKLARVLMVSCENPAQEAECTRRNWRAFRVKSKDQPLLPGEIDCPHYTHDVQCIDCGLCDGADGKSPKHIAVTVHGITSKVSKFEAMATA